MKLFEIPSHEPWACQHFLDGAIKLSRNMLYQRLGSKEPALPTSNGPPLAVEIVSKIGLGRSKAKLPKGPVSSPLSLSPGFKCDYSAMEGWRHIAAAGSRSIWLEKTISDDDSTGGDYNIFTDYDDFAPRGMRCEVRSVSFGKLNAHQGFHCTGILHNTISTSQITLLMLMV